MISQKPLEMRVSVAKFDLEMLQTILDAAYGYVIFLKSMA
jgi:hypothetical protein